MRQLIELENLIEPKLTESQRLQKSKKSDRCRTLIKEENLNNISPCFKAFISLFLIEFKFPLIVL